MHEHQLAGLDAVEMTTRLLQRRRLAHPTQGLYEAAELQFWWSRPLPSDTLDQLFWLDDDGDPIAAAILVDFGDGPSLVHTAITFCPFVMPDASGDDISRVISRGLAWAHDQGFPTVEIEVDQADDVTLQILSGRGFAVQEQAVLVECWMNPVEDREISPLSDGYRLASRADSGHTTHHMGHHRGDGQIIDDRLAQLSLYTPELDLVVLDENNAAAAYGLCWFDPTTKTGVIEPMRTMDEHQQQGLARHILTAGRDRLVIAGAERISINYEPENPASGLLYRSVGFVPDTTIDLLAGPTSSSP